MPSSFMSPAEYSIDWDSSLIPLCLSFRDYIKRTTITIDTKILKARTRKLSASFSLEAAHDIVVGHGIDIEREMVKALQYEITAELDRELLDQLVNGHLTPSESGSFRQYIKWCYR